METAVPAGYETPRGDRLKTLKIFLPLLIAGVLLLGCSQEKGNDPAFIPPSVENNQTVDVDKIHLFQLEEPKSGDTIATIETTQGAFEVVLYPVGAYFSIVCKNLRKGPSRPPFL